MLSQQNQEIARKSPDASPRIVGAAGDETNIYVVHCNPLKYGYLVILHSHQKYTSLDIHVQLDSKMNHNLLLNGFLL